MALRRNKEGYYIIDSLEKLKEWQRETDQSHLEKLKEKAEFKKNVDKIKKESLKRQKKND